MNNNLNEKMGIDISILNQLDTSDLPKELQDRIKSFLSKLDERQKSLERSQVVRFSRHG